MNEDTASGIENTAQSQDVLRQDGKRLHIVQPLFSERKL